MCLEKIGLYPSDLDVCRRVFDQICKDEQIARSSLDGEHLASRILAVFQVGERDEAKLLDLVRSQR
jgi:hypothetical protein